MAYMNSSEGSHKATSLPTSISELILPEQPSLSKTLTSLKKSRLSIHNRLTSILEDSAFVCNVAAVNKLPLIANERCGSWYVPPEEKKGSVYFKSTDGHQGHWSFSLRRLNTSLLGVLGSHGGAIIVDSTRRGKSMPDALSKTVPIWAAVLNRVLFPNDVHYHDFITPEEVVGRSEHSHIERRLGGFVRDLLDLELDVTKLREGLKKPIRVEFVTRQTPIMKVQAVQHYNTLICCSASRLEHGDGDHYVQGAGDDTENWAHGLTAPLFWTHKDLLMAETNEESLYELIESLFSGTDDARPCSVAQIYLRDVPTPVFLSQSKDSNSIGHASVDALITCDLLGAQETTQKDKAGLMQLHLGCPSGKLGGKALREKLLLVDAFLRELLQKQSNTGILVTCSTGRDLAVGVALAILCRYVNDEGVWTIDPLLHTDKTAIRRKLACITQSMPSANPSRATLQSVNTYLMGHIK